MDFIKNVFTRKDKKSKKPTDLQSNLGISGTQDIGELFDTDEQKDLAYLEDRMNIFEKMFRSEPVIRTTHDVSADPIVSSKFHFEPSDTSEKAREMATFCQNILINPNTIYSMKENFSFYLRQFLEYKAFGFACFEVIWDVIDGYIVPNHFAPRLQKTIRWDIEEDELKAIKQVNYWSSNIKKEIKPIPNTPEKLLYFVNNQRGNDYEGIGILRNQFRSWKMKQRMVNALMVGYNRYLVSVLECQLPDNATEDAMNQAKKIGKNWNSHEQSVLLYPSGFDFKIKETNMMASVHALNFIKYLDFEMALAGFAQWALLGNNGTGAYSLSTDQTDLMLMKLQGIIDYVCDKISLIFKKAVEYNFGESAIQYAPTLVGRVMDKDLNTWYKDIQRFAQTGILPIYKGLQDKIAETLELPDIPDLEEVEQEKIVEEKTKEDKKEEMNEEFMQKMKIYKENMEKLEKQFEINTENLDNFGGVKHFAEQKKIIEINEDALKKVLTPIVRKHQILIFEQLENGNKINDIKIDDLNKYTEALKKYIFDIAKKSTQAILKENKIPEDNKAKKVYKDLEIWAGQQAEAMTIKYEGDIKFKLGMLFANSELRGTEPKEMNIIDSISFKAYDELLEVFRKIGVSIG